MGQEVYVYEGPGAAMVSSNLLLSALQRCLCPRSHSIEHISPQQIKLGKWRESCAALVLGGGYDMGFLKSLGAEGADMIRDYVMQGGTYIGMCAGAYFACDYIEFEKGTKMEVCGDRPLKFYPGKCTGSIVSNFKYDSEQGAAALPITIPAKTLPGFANDCTLQAYVNGGGFFSPNSSRERFPHVQNVQNLALFDTFGGRPPAVVKCDVGQKGGVALLSSPHVDFSAFELDPTDKYLMKFQRELRNDDRVRERFLKSFLELGKLRVKVNSSL
ncbi:uncharacterized protein [Littorina saxatilis]|uniref:Biotin-protein ligase N-terminal domain-containing protein n=1 Tax=Littorina saxatilis TaxID=31220 RepID=A0AAN9B3U3_9CAEN